MTLVTQGTLMHAFLASIGYSITLITRLCFVTPYV